MLEHYPILRTRDTAAVVSLIEATAGVRLQRAGAMEGAGCDVSGLWLDRLSLASVRYGFPTTIAAGAAMDSHILSFPLGGELAFEARGGRDLVQAGACITMSPDVPFLLHADAAAHRLVMRVSAKALAHHLALLTPKSTDAAPIVFEAAPTRRDAGVDLLLRQARTAIALLDARARGPIAGDALAEIESAILTTLLLALRHNRSRDIEPPSNGTLSTRAVRAVVDFIHAHAHGGVRVEDLIAVSGVSGRTLFRHFHAAKGLGPLAYLRETRFERARADLEAAAPGDTVEAIARRWRFSHVGRFAADYRRRFGELPSDALKRATGRRR